MGLFDKFKKGLRKTTQLLKTDIRDLFKAEGRLVDAAFLEELFETLVKTDMGVDASQEIVDDVGETFRARVVQMSDIIEEIKKKLKALMAQPADPIRFAPTGPTIIMVAGVTVRQKHEHRQADQNVQEDGRRVVLGAADTFAPPRRKVDHLGGADGGRNRTGASAATGHVAPRRRQSDRDRPQVCIRSILPTPANQQT